MESTHESDVIESQVVKSARGQMYATGQSKVLLCQMGRLRLRLLWEYEFGTLGELQPVR